MHSKFLAMALAIPLTAPLFALAQEENEIDELRQQIRRLEERIEQQEAPPAAAPQSATANVPSGNAFNPAISLILDAKYRNLELDPDEYQIGGFVPPGGHGDDEEGGHGAGPGERGFGLDESELTISANIDPYLLGYFTAAVTDGEIEVEEAYVQSSGLLPGLVVKGGRFFSGIGYINEQHPHAWDFADIPLVSQVFMGGNLAEDGIQLRYIAPTPLFLELGIEGGRGAAFPGSERNKNGFNAGAAFLHLGGDVGFSNSYRIGASYRETTAAEREYDDIDAAGNEVENVFADLKSKTWGIDLIWKWAPDGNPRERNFKFQAEYFQREEQGQLGYGFDDVAETFTQEGAYTSKQYGWYTQAIYQFMPRWRAGARYDQLDSGDLEYAPISDGTLSRDDLQLLREHKPKRTTVMVDFSTSEFARFRLQYARDEARFDEKDDQIVLQYIVSLGAHGAHKF